MEGLTCLCKAWQVSIAESLHVYMKRTRLCERWAYLQKKKTTLEDTPIPLFDDHLTWLPTSVFSRDNDKLVDRGEADVSA